MKRILVPCNFSIHSERAVEFAIEIARKNEGTVFLCTVLNNHSVDENQPSIETDQAAAHEKFSKFITRFDTSGIIVLHHVRTGKITFTLLECIKQENIDLVVMGTSGSRGWNEVFMGSNIGKIVRTSPVPVLAIKNSLSSKSIRNIVFPLGLKKKENHLTAKILQLQHFFDAKLHLLFVDTNAEKNAISGLQKLQDYATINGLKKYSVNVRDNEIEKDGILLFAKEINADMIAMGTHGNRNPNNMYLSSIAADVVNHAGMITWTCATEKT